MRWSADRHATGGHRRTGIFLLLLAGLVGWCGAAPQAAPASTVPTLDEGAALRAGQAVIGNTVADYTLLDAQGRPVQLSRYRGKPLLVSFIYTGCFQVCPANTRALHAAVKRMDVMLTPNQFNVVSIGFNQPFDSPAAMRAFAAQHRIDYPNWDFLSPPQAIVETLTRDFGFSYVATPAGFDHVLGVTVLDAEGRIHAQVWGDRTTADKLGEPLRQLLRQAPLPPQMRLSDVIDRVRILCTVYDADTGEYRYDYKLLLEIVGGLAFFLGVGWYLGVEWRDRKRAMRARPVVTLSAAEHLH